MSGSIDSQNRNNVESSIHPLHSSTPSKNNNDEESPSQNVTSQNIVGSSVHPLHSSTPTRKDDDEESPSQNVVSTYDNSFESASTKHSSNTASKSRQVSDLDLLSTPTETERPPIKPLSAWEKWLCSKEVEKRKCLQKLSEEKQQKQIENHIKEQKEVEKKLLAEISREKWLKQIEEDQRRKNKIQREKAEQEKKIREEKEQLIKEIAEQRYYDWKKKKDKLKEEKEREKKDKMKVKLEKFEEKKQLNEEAYSRWLKGLSTRPKVTSSVGYGYAGGVLISYHDGTSPPRPSFCNPNPWISCTDDDDD